MNTERLIATLGRVANALCDAIEAQTPEAIPVVQGMPVDEEGLAAVVHERDRLREECESIRRSLAWQTDQTRRLANRLDEVGSATNPPPMLALREKQLKEQLDEACKWRARAEHQLGLLSTLLACIGKDNVPPHVATAVAICRRNQPLPWND